MDNDAIRQAALWDAWADHFPELYPDRDPSAIVEFLSGINPESDALELGAGSGRVALPLARRRSGRMVCLDVSPGLLSRLRERLDVDGVTTVDLVESDMAEPDLAARRFGLVYAVRSTFFHLTEQDRQISCLLAVSRLLVPNGRLVLDCFVPDLELVRAGQQVRFTMEATDAIALRAVSADPITQRMTYREIRLADGTLPRVLAVEQRYCWPSELDVIARIGSLRLLNRYSDFTGGSFTAASRRHVSVYGPVTC